jgi:DNA-binding MarR family transcriptional regulator
MTAMGDAQTRDQSSDADRLLPGGHSPGDLGDLDSFIGFKLRVAQECVFRAFAQAVNDPNLKPRRFTALCFIARYPGMSQSDLGTMVGRDKSTITPMISDLIVSGHVRREHTAADRRSFRLYLTPQGESLLAQQWAIAEAHEARIDRVLGPSEKQQFLDQLDRLITEFG